KLGKVLFVEDDGDFVGLGRVAQRTGGPDFVGRVANDFTLNPFRHVAHGERHVRSPRRRHGSRRRHPHRDVSAPTQKAINSPRAGKPNYPARLNRCRAFSTYTRRRTSGGKPTPRKVGVRGPPSPGVKSGSAIGLGPSQVLSQSVR